MVAAPLLSRLQKAKWLWGVVLTGAILGALPDLIGAHGNYVEHDNWGEYQLAHHGEVAGVLRYIPMYGLHVYLDRLTHDQGIRWWVAHERLWLEILLWLINFTVIGWMVKRWRQLKSRRSL